MSRVRSIERAFSVLTALAAGPLGVTELAERVGLPKSTVARLLDSLRADDAVEQLPGGTHYRLGPRIIALADAIRPGRDLVALAHPHLVELAAAVGEAAGLSVPEGFNVRYVDQVDTAHQVQVRDWTGTRAPMHAVSSGLVLLAALPQAALDALLPAQLDRLTLRTMTQPADLRARLVEVRLAGYAWVHGEFAEGIDSVAAAITGDGGEAVAAIHVHGPSYRFPAPGAADAIAALVVAAAARISAQIAESRRPG